MIRLEKCQCCHHTFYTDSPHNDRYCGDCRVLWYNKQKKLMGESA